MKTLYKAEDGFTIYEHKILEYKVHITKMSTGDFVVGFPYLGEGDDKKMLDDLVYYNKSVYVDRDRQKVINKVRKWINQYKVRNV